MKKPKIEYIDDRSTFNGLELDFEEVSKVLEKGELKNLLLVIQREDEDGDSYIGMKWRGNDSLSSLLGILEYVKIHLFSQSV